jgi:hypothetical protein
VTPPLDLHQHCQPQSNYCETCFSPANTPTKTLNVPPCQFPQPVVVAPSAPPIPAAEHSAPPQRVATDPPSVPIAPLASPPIRQPTQDAPEVSCSPQTQLPTPQHKTTACWTEVVQPQLANNRTTTDYLRHVNKAIDGTCRITVVQHDTSATGLKHGHRVQGPVPFAPQHPGNDPTACSMSR